MKGTARSPPAWWGSLSGRGEVTGPGRSPWLGLAGPPHCTSPCVHATHAYGPPPMCWALLRMPGVGEEVCRAVTQTKPPSRGRGRGWQPSGLHLMCLSVFLLLHRFCPFTLVSSSRCFRKPHVRGRSCKHML